MYLKAGLAQRAMKVDIATDNLFLTNLTYGGLLVGVGANVPFKETYGVRVDLETLVLGSVSESPVTSGHSTSNISWWELGAGGYFAINSTMEFEAKLLFQSNGVDFSGVGTRATPLASSTQNSRAVMLGLSYYF